MSANQPFSTRSRKPKALKQQIILFARYVLSDLSLISYSFMMFLSLTFARFLFENQIEPNVGIVSVPDPKLPVLEKINESEKVVPATLEFVDVAGLVKGASAGEGL